MSFASTPAQTPITLYLTHHIRTMLPPPVEDTQDEYLRRDNAALALLLELAPLTVLEAEQAALVVACNAYGMDCLRLAGTVGTDVRLAMRCVAQAASMFRQSEAARRRLAKLQAGRATPATATDAEAAGQSAAESATPSATQPAARSAVPLAAQSATPPPAGPPATQSGAQSGARTPVEDPDAKALAEAEAFARQSPRRAIHIRRLGCVPKGISYTPPRPAVVRALVSGQTPALRKLDRKVA